MQNQPAPKTLLFFSPNDSDWSSLCHLFYLLLFIVFFPFYQTPLTKPERSGDQLAGPFLKIPRPPEHVPEISGLFLTLNLGGSEPSRNKSPTRWSPPGRSAGRGRRNIWGGGTDVPTIKDLKLESLCLSGRVRRKMQKDMRKVVFVFFLFSDSCVCTCDSVMSGWLKETVLSCKEM